MRFPRVRRAYTHQLGDLAAAIPAALCVGDRLFGRGLFREVLAHHVVLGCHVNRLSGQMPFLIRTQCSPSPRANAIANPYPTEGSTARQRGWYGSTRRGQEVVER